MWPIKNLFFLLCLMLLPGCLAHHYVRAPWPPPHHEPSWRVGPRSPFLKHYFGFPDNLNCSFCSGCAGKYYSALEQRGDLNYVENHHRFLAHDPILCADDVWPQFKIYGHPPDHHVSHQFDD